LYIKNKLNIMDRENQEAHVRALIKILLGLYDLDCIGELFGSSTAGWIADDIDYVEIAFLNQSPNSSYQLELFEKGVDPISYGEAVDILHTRIKNSLPQTNICD
jgi:hypothetical protein